MNALSLALIEDRQRDILQKVGIIVSHFIRPFRTGYVGMTTVERFNEPDSVIVEIDSMPDFAFTGTMAQFMRRSCFKEDLLAVIALEAGRHFGRCRIEPEEHIILGEN